MVSGLPGQGVNGNSAAAVGPIETMVSGLPGQGVNGVNGNKAAVVGPIETMAPGLAGFQGWWSCCLFPGGFVHDYLTRSTL